MEDLISFDLWGVMVPGQRDGAIFAMTRLRPDTNRKAILLEIVRNAGTFVLIGKDVAWASAAMVVERLRTTFDPIHMYQSGYGPLDIAVLKQCPIHSVHYAGVVGCPVCSGWIRPPRETDADLPVD